MSKPTAAIFDMDGTLVNVTSVHHHLFAEPRDFAAFHNGSADCPPMSDIVQIAVALHYLGHDIVIVTGRERQYEPVSTGWLDQHLPVPYVGPYMRADGDRRPAALVKEEILAELLADGYDVIFAADDDPKNVSMFERNGIDTLHVPGWVEA